MTIPLDKAKSSHDIVINLDGSIEMVIQSKKLKAVVLVKWLTKKGIEKIQGEHQQPITDCGNQIQAMQHENTALQVELRAKNQQKAALKKRYVGYLAIEDKNNGIAIIAKSNEEAV